MRRPDAQSSPSPTESPIVAWLTDAAVKQAIAKAARSLRLLRLLAAEGKPEDFISQVASLVEENALLKSDDAVLRNEIASLAKRLDKVRAELDAIKRAVARGLNKEDFRSGHFGPPERQRPDAGYSSDRSSGAEPSIMPVYAV
jgi:hypothetical protein